MTAPFHRSFRPVVEEVITQRGVQLTEATSSKHRRARVTCLDDVTGGYVLNTADVAAILDISATKACELLATGTITGGFRVGRLFRIQAGDLRSHIDGQRLPLRTPLDRLRQTSRRRSRGAS